MTDKLVHDIAEFLSSLPLGEDTVRERANVTIVPPAQEPGTTEREALARLDQAELELGRTLGEGGMAVVRLAEQVALGRQVAVKALKEERRSEAATMELLREAWITGALEHPNVVPIYDIAVDADGSPQIVLKRIEGVEWSELVDDPDLVRERHGAEDLLEWNLRIFLQLCNAIRFAHSRGIIHRDIKPDNVMVGEFDEVYVLDWGIALSLVDDGSGRLPLAKHATDMAGTPSYMAPEMLGGDEMRLSERTDIYLLGGVLYHILAGEPPHKGDNAMEMVTSVVESKPELPPEITPPALADICKKAMSAEPEDRYASVEEMQREVRSFLEHRGSALLALRAERKLGQLLSLLEEEEGDPAERRQHLYILFGQCRFGFGEALAAWPDNPDARRGRRRAVEAMARYELGQGFPRGASLLLSEIGDEAPPELIQRVDREIREREERRRRLAELERELDPAVGLRTRLLLGLVLGALWTVTPALAALLEQRETMITHPRIVALNGGLLAVAFALGFWVRRPIQKSWFNRRSAAAVFAVLSASVVLGAGAWLAGVDPVVSQVMHLAVWFTVAAMFSASVEWRMAPTAAGYLAGFFVACAWPPLRLYAMSVCNLILTINVAIIWGGRAPADKAVKSD